jgi:CheY-like chemotaxis protein
MSCPQGHRGIILVADDNEANRELLSEVLGAASPLRADNFHAIFLDLRMPPPDGIQPARQSCEFHINDFGDCHDER